jgi:transcriptional regulator
VRLCLEAYVLTNMPLTEDVLKELESLYNYVDESELTVSYNRLELPHFLICDIIK